jgi:5-methylcytosine-specific restriction endonuclease McrA
MLTAAPKTCACRDCGRRLPFTSKNFKSHRNLPHGLERICRRCHRSSVSRWTMANRDQRRANDAHRRARKRTAVDPQADHAAIRAVYEDAYYASQFVGEPYAVDHVVPLCRGGMHTPHNLRHIPAALNAIKGGRLDAEVDDPTFRSWLLQSVTGPTFEQIVYVSLRPGKRSPKRSPSRPTAAHEI